MPDIDDLVSRLRAAGCVFAEDEARLLHAAASSPADLDSMAYRRVHGEPLEYIVGWVEFRGLRIGVEPGVFVPRARTGYLVELALAGLRPGSVVVDLCCGTGALGAAIASEAADGVVAQLHAVDIDDAAVRCARRNLPDAAVHAGDLFDALPDRLNGRIDVILANAPYVPSAEIAMMPSEARDHEHRVALDGGADGLDVQRRVIAAAPHWLAVGGRLLVETSDGQAPRTEALMRAAGLTAGTAACPELGSTVSIGQRRPTCRWPRLNPDAPT